MRYPFATWQPSPNFSSRGLCVVDKIIIHITDGQARTDRTAKHLCNPAPDNGKRVSSHFLIGQVGDGDIFQLVDTDQSAWHCSGWNRQSVGIEHVARTPGELALDDPGLPLTSAQLEASARLVAWLCYQFGLSLDAQHIMPHCASPITTHADCGRDVLAGGIWPWASYWEQLRNAAQMLAAAGAM